MLTMLQSLFSEVIETIGVLDGLNVILQTWRLVDVVQAFESNFPTLKLRLHVEALSAVPQLDHVGIANIGSGGLYTTDRGLKHIQVGDVEIIPVGHNHPLARGNPNAPAGPSAVAARADGWLTFSRRGRTSPYLPPTLGGRPTR